MTDPVVPSYHVEIRHLSVLSYANGFTLWHYKAKTLMEDVLAQGYFQPVADMLTVGDMILVSWPEAGAIVFVASIGHDCVKVISIGMTSVARRKVDMTDKCEPPPELRCKDGWHWLEHDFNDHLECVWWDGKRQGWLEKKTCQTHSPGLMEGWGWHYLCPVPTPDEIKAQQAREARLVSAIKSILAADERGQGQPFADAMDRAAKLVEWKS